MANSSYIAITGRQSKLSVAELEAVFGSANIKPLNEEAVLVSDGNPDIAKLGGTLKLAKVLTESPAGSWHQTARQLEKTFIEYLKDTKPEGKIKLGLSAYDKGISTKQLLQTALTMKKLARHDGYSLRVVQNDSSVLNAASVLYNKLTQTNGLELITVTAANRTFIARTVGVQDIDAYAARDQARPKRDAFVGMLPPKLAQIMLNLAVGKPEKAKLAIWDPFCGTGVILQEALLMGHDVIGSDLSKRMVDYTRENLDWLSAKYTLEAELLELSAGDARKLQPEPPFDIVVAETYLGEPLTSPPVKARMDRYLQESEELTLGTLENISREAKSGTKIVLAIPAWKHQNDYISFVDRTGVEKITGLGYNLMSFEHISNDDLLYSRPDAIVARRLLALEKI